jgi:hypothetical protein
MTPDRSSAILIILGAILFMMAAFSPVSRVFAVPDPAAKLAIIQASPSGWLAAQLLFALGALVTAAGVGLLAARTAGPAASPLAWSAAALAVGALLWSWHVYLRAVDPARFTAGEIPFWLFAGYSLLTLIGLALLGLAVLRMGMPAWLAWLCMGGAGILLVLAVLLGDMPPFVYYLITLTVGIILYRAVVPAAVAAASVTAALLVAAGVTAAAAPAGQAGKPSDPVRPAMDDVVYTLAEWRVRPEKEAEFVTAWQDLGAVFARLPDPPGTGTLLRSVNDPTLFYSFGPWSRLEAVEAMRADPDAQAAIRRLVELCTDATPGTFRLVARAEAPSPEPR